MHKISPEPPIMPSSWDDSSNPAGNRPVFHFPAGHYLTWLPFTVRVVRVFRGSQRLRGDVAAEMRAIELDALHGGIGCGLGGASIWFEKSTFPCPISDPAANMP